jgi:hypothetical protein
VNGSIGAALPLPGVVVVCVDTRLPKLALRALEHCLRHVQPAAAVLFTDPAWAGVLPTGITRQPAVVESVPAYSAFMQRGLHDPVRRLAPGATHVLVVQWDGYVVDPRAWEQQLLACDYIGASWHDVAGDAGVGNGGFSLRSMRLLQALQESGLAAHHPEDLCICREHRAVLQQRYGIRFAPRSLAERFAFERTEPTKPTFGFHGMFNFDRVMSNAELDAQLRQLPDALMRGLDGHDLCVRLIERGDLATARLIVDARRRLGMRDRRTWRLRARLGWAQWRRGGHASTTAGNDR